MTTGSSPKIDLRLSEKSQAELRKFLETLQDVHRSVKLTDRAFKTINASIVQNATALQSAKQDLKQFKMIADAMERNAIMRNGPGSYFQGVDFKANRRAAATSRLGSGIGQQIELQQEQLALAKKGLSFARQQDTLLQAQSLKLGTQARTINKITNLDKARQLAMAAQVRQGIEAANGETRRANSAARIYELAKARVAVLTKEARIAEQLARAEERRPRIIARNLKGDREMENSQAVAGWRKRRASLSSNGGADVFGVQAQIMANYVAMNAARNAVVSGAQFSADLDESMRNLQAITVVTDENLKKLKKTLLDVSEETKFFATDIANAAVTLGQAGFSTKEIEDSIRAVSLLATATGTDLNKSVDLTTSILGVFNMESAQMSGVADTLTAAVNNSKLNIDKLALGLQYAGNTASQSGVSFEELTASLGAMANAGIRSGSTLGTGMRQIMIALQKPSGKFQESLARLGITMEEVDLRSNGLYGVMKNLKEGGFTAADAIRSFEVRAASAFNALSGNLSEVVKLERAFLNSAAATKANETQMRAMSNQYRRFTANLQAVISKGLEPLVYTIRNAFSAMADGLQVLGTAPEFLQVAVTGLTSLAAAFVAVRVASLALGMSSIVLGFSKLKTAVVGATTVLGAFGAASTLALGPIALIAAALGIGAVAWYSYRSEVEQAEKAAAKAQTGFDTTVGAMEAMGSQIQMVDGRIKELSDRTGTLTENEDLLQLETEKVREQFRAMGLELGENVGSVAELIGALQSLRGELAKEYKISIGATAHSLELLRAAGGNQEDALRGTLRLGKNTNKRYRKNGKHVREADFFQSAASPSNDLQDLYRLQTEGAALLQAYQQAQQAGDIAWLSTDSDILQRLREAQTTLASLIELKSQDLSLERQLGDIKRSNLVAGNREAHSDLVSRVGKFGLNTRGRTLRSVEGVDDPLKRFEAAKGEIGRLQTEAVGLQKEIEGNTDLLPEVRQNLLQNIQNNLAEAEVLLDSILETAKDTSETRQELQQMRLEAKADRLGSGVSLSEDPEQVDSLTAKRYNNLQAQLAAQVADLRVRAGGDTSSAAYVAELAKFEAEFEEQQKRINDEAQTRLGELVSLQLRNLNVRRQQLVSALQEAVNPEDREGIRDELKAVAEAQATLMEEQAELTITGAEDLAIRRAELRQDELETLARIVNDQEEDNVAEAQKAFDTAKTALDETRKLAQVATTKAALAEAMKQRIVALANLATAANGLVEAQTDAGEDTPENLQARMQAELRAIELDGDRTFNAAQRRIDRPSGGNPYTKKRDYIDKLINDLEAKLDVAENYLKAGQTAGAEYDDVMDTALAKVSEIHSQISTLQAKLKADGLTVQEQEKLNTLIDQQARLTTFIAAEEMRIARIKMQQGQLAEGVLLTTKSWARENLSMSMTLQDGLTSALSNAKNALTDFFTAWSDGTKSGKEAFKGLAVSVLKSIQQIFAEMLAVAILQKALGWLGGAIGGDVGAGLTELATNLREGGAVKNAAMGEHVRGNLNRDSQRYNLMPGEYVLRRSAVQAVGVKELDRLNSMGNNIVSAGSHQGAANQTNQKTPTGSTMNIYLVDERSQAGQMGPMDVLAIVNDDISKGGTTKKLIKSVQTGSM
jgi:TP901 family phage tail tape measure protein